jgi:ParB family transcriptional regulator, chromosome partitioning protein
MLEPLLVRRDPADPGRYQLIAGERRHRAAEIVGLDTVPVTVREASDRDLLELAIVENVQREDLNPIEQAKGYRRLMEVYEETGTPLSQQQLADKVGKSRAVVANLLRLLDLGGDVQESIAQGALTQGHGKILAGLEEDLRKRAWEFALKERASVRALEDFLKKQSEGNAEPAPKKKSSPTSTEAKDPHFQYVEDALRERLRTKVHLNVRKDSSGAVTIEFFNQEDLERLLESLGIEL